MIVVSPPDYRRGFLRIPLAIWLEVYCRAPVTRRQLQLISFILRESWGWQTPEGDPFAWTRVLYPRDFARATGLTTDHIARDLRNLLARNILLEQEHRYHFVPDLRLWKTLDLFPAEPSLTGVDEAFGAAETSPLEPGVKKAKIEERNGPAEPDGELSTAVDNRPLTVNASAPAHETDPLNVDRFVSVVASFVGSLSSTDADELRRWICEEGIASVWRTLEPSLRSDWPAAQRHLQESLALRRRASGESPLRENQPPGTGA